MTVVLILALLVVIFAVSTYNKFSYSIWSKRCYINSKHPDWTPYCGTMINISRIGMKS